MSAKNFEIRFVCERCGQTITEPGALLFSPPDNHNRTYKHHICPKCYREIIEQFVLYNSQNTKTDEQNKRNKQTEPKNVERYKLNLSDSGTNKTSENCERRLKANDYRFILTMSTPIKQTIDLLANEYLKNNSVFILTHYTPYKDLASHPRVDIDEEHEKVFYLVPAYRKVSNEGNLSVFLIRDEYNSEFPHTLGVLVLDETDKAVYLSHRYRLQLTNMEAVQYLNEL